MSASVDKARRRELRAAAAAGGAPPRDSSDAALAAFGRALKRQEARVASGEVKLPPSRGWRRHIPTGRASGGRAPAQVRVDNITHAVLAAAAAAARVRAGAADADERGDLEGAARCRAAAADASNAAAAASASKHAADVANAAAAEMAADASDAARAESIPAAAVAVACAASKAREAAAAHADALSAANHAAAAAAAADAVAAATGGTARSAAAVWAEGAVHYSGRVGGAAVWLKAQARRRGDVLFGEPGTVTIIARQAARAAEMGALNAAVARIASDASEGAAAVGDVAGAKLHFDRARSRWAHVAFSLPPDIAAKFSVGPARHPADVADIVWKAGDHAADIAAGASAKPVDVVGIAREINGAPPAPSVPAAEFEGAAPAHVEVDDDEPESGYKYFLTRLRDGNFAGLYHGDWRLPAGGAPYETCGKYLRLKGCALGDHSAEGVPFDTATAVEDSCRRIDCPICFEKSFERKAARIVGRMYGYVGLRRCSMVDWSREFTGGEGAAAASGDRYRPGPRKRIPLHGVLSAPDSMYAQLSTEKGVKAANAFVRRRLAAMGFEAAAVLFHPFRFDKKNGGAPYYSPHFHVFVFGWASGETIARLHAADGWVYKTIRAIKTVEHLYSAVLYVLSHVGIATLPSGRAADVYRYFGNLGTRKFGAYEVLEAQKDMPSAIKRILDARSKGKYPLLPAAVREGGSMDGAEWVPSISARLYVPADKTRRDAEGHEWTVTEFATLAEDVGMRVDNFEVASRDDYGRLLDRLGGAMSRDNPAYRPINRKDVVWAPPEVGPVGKGGISASAWYNEKGTAVDADGWGFNRHGVAVDKDGEPLRSDDTEGITKERIAEVKARLDQRSAAEDAGKFKSAWMDKDGNKITDGVPAEPMYPNEYSILAGIRAAEGARPAAAGAGEGARPAAAGGARAVGAAVNGAASVEGRGLKYLKSVAAAAGAGEGARPAAAGAGEGARPARGHSHAFIPMSAVARAAGEVEGERMPPVRICVVQVAYVPAAGVTDIDPTKRPPPRYIVFTLEPRLTGLCLICRRPLKVCVLDTVHGRLPVHAWLPGEPILVPRDRIALYNPEDHMSLPIYSREDATKGCETRVAVAPPHMAAYPPHAQARVRRQIAESKFSYQEYVLHGKRPDAEAIARFMAGERERLRAISPGITVDDR